MKILFETYYGKSPEPAIHHPFDSNMITPGTEFMNNLSPIIKGYITDRLKNNPEWSDLEVIYSDVNCPGEGEHKIMNFIRNQSLSQERRGILSRNRMINPIKHCFYGLDADLTVLSLTTHEPLCTVIMEDVWNMRCYLCGSFGHLQENCLEVGTSLRKTGPAEEDKLSLETKFVAFDAALFRTCLYKEWESIKPKLNFPFKLDRLINDFVFMTYLVGNDFLPAFPGFDLVNDSVYKLFIVYKYSLPKMNDYIVNEDRTINLESAMILFQALGSIENSFLRGYSKYIKYYFNRFSSFHKYYSGRIPLVLIFLFILAICTKRTFFT